MDRAAGQPAGALHGPALDEGAVDESPARLGQVGAAFRHRHVDTEAHVLAEGGDLPQHVVGVRAGLTQFEIRRAHLVRPRTRREGNQEHQQQKQSVSSPRRHRDRAWLPPPTALRWSPRTCAAAPRRTPGRPPAAGHWSTRDARPRARLPAQARRPPCARQETRRARRIRTRRVPAIDRAPACPTRPRTSRRTGSPPRGPMRCRTRAPAGSDRPRLRDWPWRRPGSNRARKRSASRARFAPWRCGLRYTCRNENRGSVANVAACASR